MDRFDPRELSPALKERWNRITPGCACYHEWYGSARCAAHQRIIDEHVRTNEFRMMVDSYHHHAQRAIA